MKPQFFPKQEYWLNSPLSQDAVAKAISNDIYSLKNKGVIDFIDEFVDDTTRTFRYFEGRVTPTNFQINRYHLKGRYPTPLINGYITSASNGSNIQIVAEMPGRDKILLGLSMPIAIYWSCYYHIFWLMLFSLLSYIFFRFDFSKKSKGDKAELIEILNATEINNPIAQI